MLAHITNAGSRPKLPVWTLRRNAVLGPYIAVAIGYNWFDLGSTPLKATGIEGNLDARFIHLNTMPYEPFTKSGQS